MDVVVWGAAWMAGWNLTTIQVMWLCGEGLCGSHHHSSKVAALMAGWFPTTSQVK